jgi:hypothetical protein
VRVRERKGERGRTHVVATVALVVVVLAFEVVLGEVVVVVFVVVVLWRERKVREPRGEGKGRRREWNAKERSKGSLRLDSGRGDGSSRRRRRRRRTVSEDEVRTLYIVWRRRKKRRGWKGGNARFDRGRDGGGGGGSTATEAEVSRRPICPWSVERQKSRNGRKKLWTHVLTVDVVGATVVVVL